MQESNSLNECKLGFQDQCRVVWEGLRKGVRYDGCTGVPDFDFGADCCGEHDYYYQIQSITRAEADRRLRECIIKKGYPLIAWSFYLGLRAGGWVVWNNHRKKLNEAITLDSRDIDADRLRDNAEGA